MDVIGALRRVVAALEDASIEYCVVGSVASSSWGAVRHTRDADLIAVINAESLDALLVRLSSPTFYIPVDRARSAAVAADGSFNVIDTVGGGKVDIFVADPGNEFNKSRLSRRVRADDFGFAMWIATPEDVVLAKLRWRLDSRSEVQWRDCVEIVASNELDWPYLRHWAPILGVDEDLAELEAPT